MTNAHVLAGGIQAEVYDHQGQLIGSAAHVEALALGADLAILPALGSAPAVVRLADQLPSVGSRIIVIGAPRGLSNTVSEGIVSAQRDMAGRRLLQITAPISPGSSGGPVLDESGRVVGVSVGLLQDGQNLNFAIPSRDASALASSPAGRLPFPDAGFSRAAGHDASASSTSVDAISWTRANTQRLHPGQTAGRVAQLRQGQNWFREYHVEGRGGDVISLRASSTDFDIFLEVYQALADTMILVAEDDDSGLGTDAQLTFRLPGSGVYMIVVGGFENTIRDDRFLIHMSNGSNPPPYGDTERWIRVTQNRGNIYLLDRLTLSRTTAGNLRVWYKVNYLDIETLSNGTRYNTTTELYEVNCVTRRSRGMKHTYHLDGRVADSEDRPGAWFEWTPSSVGESVFLAACATAKQLRR